MSTPNFALKNASRYFVFGMPVFYTQEEIDERTRPGPFRRV